MRHLAALAASVLLAITVGSAFAQSCAPTKPDALGPFYLANAPERSKTGEGLVVSGRVRSASACTPIAGARIEWWSANRQGDYDETHRATQVTDADGRYRYETDPPGRYPGRPPHLHLKITAPGHRTLVTQLYPKPDDTAIQVDLVVVKP